MEAAPATWRRVHIVGGMGSGKTTLANRLGRRLDVPVYDLDLVAYEGGAGRKRSVEERLASAHEIAAQMGWVTEGVYLWWIDELIGTADVVIWLDVPWRVAAWRIVKRHVLATLRRNNRHPGWRKLLRFTLASRRWYLERVPRTPSDPADDGATSRVATARYLQPYARKVLRNPWL